MIVPLVYKEISQQNLAVEIASNLGTTASTNQQLISQPHFDLSEAGLSFVHPEARSSNKLLIDFNSGPTGWRVKRSSHEKLIKKALGKSDGPLHILDCTAGMLQDALLFLSLGHHVTAIEQSKILFLLLQDAVKRSKETHNELFKNFSLIHGNACSFDQNAGEFDVIYYDPMYPPSKKSALGSGQLEYLSKILEVEQISNEPQMDFEVLQLMPVKKMIVKRSIKAEPFDAGINYQVTGKTTRFDVYI